MLKSRQPGSEISPHKINWYPSGTGLMCKPMVKTWSLWIVLHFHTNNLPPFSYPLSIPLDFWKYVRNFQGGKNRVCTDCVYQLGAIMLEPGLLLKSACFKNLNYGTFTFGPISSWRRHCKHFVRSENDWISLLSNNHFWQKTIFELGIFVKKFLSISNYSAKLLYHCQIAQNVCSVF